MRIEILDLNERTLPLAPELDRFPYSCKYCLYWEHPEKLYENSPGFEERALEEKREWVKNAERKFGTCGKILFADGKAAVYSQYGPPAFFPNTEGYSSGPPSEDAVFLACLFVGKREYRGLGLGSKLLVTILEELRGRGFRAAETFARKEGLENPSGPVELYLSHEFFILRDDPEYPLMRLDL